MKAINKFLACALLTASVIIQPMDKPETAKPKKKKTSKYVPSWVIMAGNTILGKKSAQATPQSNIQKTRIAQDISFMKLPTEVKITIMDSLTTVSEASSLKDITKALRTLARVSTQFNELINDPQFFFSFMKHYANIFKTNDSMICILSQMQSSKMRLAIQNALINDICNSDFPDKLRFNELTALGIDPYFTDLNDDTPAELCIRNYNIDGLKMLLDFGVDPEFIGKNGISLYDLAASRANHQLARPMIELIDNAISEKKSQAK